MAKIKFRIMETEPRIKALFDNKIALPDNVTFFVFYNGDAGMWRLLYGIFIGCLIVAFPASWLTSHDPPNVLDYFIGISGTIMMFVGLGWWLKTLSRNQVVKAREGKYRCGVFFFADRMIVRISGTNECYILPKERVRRASIRWFSSSDSSDEQLITLAYSGASKDEEELIVDGTFILGYAKEEVMEYINNWKNSSAWKGEGLMIKHSVG